MSGDISIKDYQLFRAFLEESCGILLGDNKAYLVNSRLKPVMKRHDISDLGKLVTRLNQTDGRLLREEVIDAMTTNETLWFRDSHPFEILKRVVFPEAEKSQKRLKIWSAACSTGQEPYSIAITAKEYQKANPGGLKFGLDILASDISSTVLAVAREGAYESLAIGRGMPDLLLKKYFNALADGRWQILPELKSMIDFFEINLLESFQRAGRNLDVVFCRNVLIYFSNDLKREILSKIHHALKPGGFLFLGASESLNGMSDQYEMVQCRPGIVYKAK